jgi:hypothetical protein
MGPDADPMAVVDQYCHVKGVQGPNRATASFTPVSTFADLMPDGGLRGACVSLGAGVRGVRLSMPRPRHIP